MDFLEDTVSMLIKEMDSMKDFFSEFKSENILAQRNIDLIGVNEGHIWNGDYIESKITGKRYTFKGGAPLHAISAFLGHRDISSTEIYTKIEQLELRGCVDTMEF